MDNRVLTAGLVFGAVILLGMSAIVLLGDNGSKGMEARVLSATRPRHQAGGAGDDGPAGLSWLLHWLGRTIRGRTRFYAESDILQLEGMISGVGLNPDRLLPLILGLKALLTVAIPLAVFVYARIAGFSGPKQFAALCVAVPFGLMGPNWVLAWMRRPYLAALRRGIPDALDLLVVCSEAGMALETALQHVSTEIRHSNVPVSIALAKLLDELMVLPDRREAFRNFGERTACEGARRLATMLGQSMQYGTPLSQVLRTIAVDLRRDRVTALETKAARLPVLLVIPLIVFIMPSMFIVLAGPPMMRLTDTLHAVAHHEPVTNKE